MIKKYWWILFIVIIIVAIFLGIKNNKQTIINDQQIKQDVAGLENGWDTPTDQEEAGFQASLKTPEVREFTITAKNFSLTPNTITVQKGDTVKITFVNSDGFHDFKIDEFNISTNKISTDKQEIVTFVADKTGSFEYYCSVGNHKSMGMKGILSIK